MFPLGVGSEGHEDLNQSSLRRKSNFVGKLANRRVGARNPLLPPNGERHNKREEVDHERTRTTLLPAPAGTVVIESHTLER